ncbi:hypothetical protein DYH10_00185 [Candidatus Saccharibacteria bacterium CPR2]|nr:hypothetical protein [Candidatus Saccharibacteria bacterium CPR2]
MLLIAFFNWWYGQGWVWIAKRSINKIQNLADNFSVGILLRTLFAPWKQIVFYTGTQSAIGIKLRALVDNMVSRLVGFMVRTFVLIAAGFSLVLATVAGILIVVLWPLLPILVIVLALAGVGVAGL